MRIKFKTKVDRFDDRIGDFGKQLEWMKEGDVIDLNPDDAWFYLSNGFACLINLNDMFEIPMDKTGELELIGRGSGASLELCIYLGHKHKPDFDETAIAYSVEEVTNDKELPYLNGVTVSFWKAKFSK